MCMNRWTSNTQLRFIASHFTVVTFSRCYNASDWLTLLQLLKGWTTSMANTCYHADKICSELTSLGPQFALLVHYSVNQIMTSPTVVWFIYFFVCLLYHLVIFVK